MPLPVTVVVPSFQQARFLRAAIDSILAQDHPAVEVLVLDGGSTDGSLEILRSYGPRIRYRSGPDRGQVAAINEGFRQGRGAILAWLNSDDVLYPGAIRRAVDALQHRPDAAAVYGEGDLIDAGGAVLRRFPETVPFDLWRLAHVADYILQPTVFLRREPLFAVGLLDESLHWGFDWDLWLRLGARWPLVHCPARLAASRLHAGTKTATGGWARLAELRRILRRHGHGARLGAPALWAHGVSTAVQKVLGGAGERPLDADELARRAPRPGRRLVRGLAARGERMLRRWLQNAQGVWPDGAVARTGHVWLPNDGLGATVHLRGRNLAVPEQEVSVSVEGARGVVRTARLAPGEPFGLDLPLPRLRDPRRPLALRLRAAKVMPVEPLDPGLGPRSAGWRLVAME
jgi:hypothetical protein